MRSSSARTIRLAAGLPLAAIMVQPVLALSATAAPAAAPTGCPAVSAASRGSVHTVAARPGVRGYRVSVPKPGRYNVSISLRPLAGTAPIVDLVSGGRLVKHSQHVVAPRASRSRIAAVSLLAATQACVLDVGVRAVAGRTSVVNVTATPAAASVAPVTGTDSGVTASSTGAAPAGQAPGGSKAAWVSGAYPGGGINAAAAASFATYRNRSLDVVDVFHMRGSWSDITSNTWTESQYAGYKSRLSVAVPLIPDSSSPAELADVAAGRRDDAFRGLARSLVAMGRGDSIVRLGWEFNGDWYSWAAKDGATWTAAFRRAAQVIKAEAPGVAIDYNGVLGYSHVSGDPLGDLYPGDDVVDIVGVDAYDNEWTHVTDSATWQTFLTGRGGLQRWADFAKAHGKQFSVPEWGLDNKGGGDNPFFIQQMHDWFGGHASALAYESYFDEPDSYIASSLDRGQNVRSAALYRSLWGS